MPIDEDDSKPKFYRLDPNTGRIRFLDPEEHEHARVRFDKHRDVHSQQTIYSLFGIPAYKMTDQQAAENPTPHVNFNVSFDNLKESMERAAAAVKDFNKASNRATGTYNMIPICYLGEDVHKQEWVDEAEYLENPIPNTRPIPLSKFESPAGWIRAKGTKGQARGDAAAEAYAREQQKEQAAKDAARRVMNEFRARYPQIFRS